MLRDLLSTAMIIASTSSPTFSTSVASLVLSCEASVPFMVPSMPSASCNCTSFGSTAVTLAMTRVPRGLADT